jgi:hypothetical protein
MTPLVPHPSTPERAVEVAASVTHVGGDRLRFAYRLVGVGVEVPLPAPSQRKDGLWEHTCFEAFVEIGDGPAYVELNFSPSGEWAAYVFERYRAGATHLRVTPEITVRQGTDTVELEAELDLAHAGAIGLAAVVETVDGRTSYWALDHPSETPDFHNADAWEAP